MLGLLGLQIFEATAADIADLGEEHGHRMLRVGAHPHMLHHTFVTTMLDAGVDLRDVQIAARHADPRTTMRYDRAWQNLDRNPNYILAACMASGT
jgi:site-specific recombinase XerD